MLTFTLRKSQVKVHQWYARGNGENNNVNVKQGTLGKISFRFIHTVHLLIMCVRACACVYV